MIIKIMLTAVLAAITCYASMLVIDDEPFKWWKGLIAATFFVSLAAILTCMFIAVWSY